MMFYDIGSSSETIISNVTVIVDASHNIVVSGNITVRIKRADTNSTAMPFGYNGNLFTQETARMRFEEIAAAKLDAYFRPVPRRRVNEPWWRDYATPPLYATDEMPQNAIKPEVRRSKSTHADRVQRKRRRFLHKLRAI